MTTDLPEGFVTLGVKLGEWAVRQRTASEPAAIAHRHGDRWDELPADLPMDARRCTWCGDKIPEGVFIAGHLSRF